MSLLVGLPLKLFYLLFLLLRLALPVLVIVGVVWLLRALNGRRGGAQRSHTQQKPKEPEFKGPVYTVDYEEVDEKE